ncbi:MAG: 2-dehydropantoate 2-reductase [Arenibacterium sp.]
MSDSPRIVVAGAGAIGCYVGARLLAAGHDVTFLGRARLGAEIEQHGLTVSDFHGPSSHIERPAFKTDPSCLAGADIVLVAVKSAATAAIAADIARHAPTATVISLQNGISNPETLRDALPQADVRAAIVPFNVVQTGPGAFHQSTSGDILLEDPVSTLAKTLSVPGLAVHATKDILPAQWGKLRVNLNNALNALSGLAQLEQLKNRAWRVLLAAQMRETLNVLKAAGITPARFTAAPPTLVPHILRLPTLLFRRIAKAMLTIDPTARSSMQDDLTRNRLTEIDALQGEVQRLAGEHGIETPTIDRVVRAIRAAEAANAGPPGLDPAALRG